MEGEQADAAEEVISGLDERFPGLRMALLAEQKLAGLRLVDEAVRLHRQQ
jgi:hypothetical protein